MKIAIIGAGLCGLSTAYFLLHEPDIDASITLFDKRGVGKGASGKASGLLHPYAGKRANLSYKAEEAFPEAISLIEAIDRYSIKQFQKPVIVQRGILRPAISTQQLHDFTKRAYESNPFPVQLLSSQESTLLYENPFNLPSLLIPSGIAIDAPQYLHSLHHAALLKGLQFEKIEIASIEEIKSEFDYIILAAGYETKKLLPQEISTNSVKGQKITVQLQNEIQLPTHALSGTAYSIFFPNRTASFGATYEHNYIDETPNPEYAIEEIFSKVANFWPKMSTQIIQSIDAGIRATTHNSHPLFFFKNPNIWAITGVGSKGLLYHAWLSKKIVNSITSNTYIK